MSAGHLHLSDGAPTGSSSIPLMPPGCAWPTGSHEVQEEGLNHVSVRGHEGLKVEPDSPDGPWLPGPELSLPYFFFRLFGE